MKTTNNDVAIIIPIYNEEKVIASVLNEVLKDFDFVVAVNDASTDKTAKEIKKTKAVLLSHLANLDQGGALETGIKYALTNPNIKYFVTFDADGQHRIADVKRMLEEIRKGNHDIILGSRFLDKSSNVPLSKRIMLRAAIIFTNLTTGVKLTDTHNGLRVFNKKYAEKLDLANFGKAHASEFIEIIKKGSFKYKEIPITIDYTEYSRSKGQPIINLVNIVFDLIFRGK